MSSYIYVPKNEMMLFFYNIWFALRFSTFFLNFVQNIKRRPFASENTLVHLLNIIVHNVSAVLQPM